MSTRLQVVVDGSELEQIRLAAQREGTTVSEWVRRTLRLARDTTASGAAESKLAVLRAAGRYEFPAPDIDQMLEETQRGYLG